MKALLIIVSLVSALIIIGRILAERKVAALRASGLYPKKGEETEADVVRLIERGEPVFAMRCYRSLHNVSLREARIRIVALSNTLQKPRAR